MGRFTHSLNLRPSTRVIFEEYIDSVKEVVHAGYYFYLKRRGKFDSMSACWNNLEQPQHREVAILLGLFYDESFGDRKKETWSILNLKKYLNLGYMKLDDLPKFRSAYFVTFGDYQVFV